VADTHLLSGGFSVGRHGAERSGVCSVNIPRVSIAVDERGRRIGEKSTSIPFAVLASVDAISKGSHSESLSESLPKLLFSGSPYR
jgi:hypothetical protein